MPCWFDPTVKLGDILTAGSALGAAWWVGHIIQRRDANQRAVKEMVSGFCGDALDSLANLSTLIDLCSTQEAMPVPTKTLVMNGMTDFSNNLLIIEESFGQSGMTCKNGSLQELLSLREELRALIIDPLVTENPFHPDRIRQIRAGIVKTKLSMVRFKLEIIRNC